jgi:hypothetical protein
MIFPVSTVNRSALSIGLVRDLLTDQTESVSRSWKKWYSPPSSVKHRPRFLVCVRINSICDIASHEHQLQWSLTYARLCWPKLFVHSDSSINWAGFRAPSNLVIVLFQTLDIRY